MSSYFCVYHYLKWSHGMDSHQLLLWFLPRTRIFIFRAMKMVDKTGFEPIVFRIVMPSSWSSHRA